MLVDYSINYDIGIYRGVSERKKNGMAHISNAAATSRITSMDRYGAAGGGEDGGSVSAAIVP